MAKKKKRESRKINVNRGPERRSGDRRANEFWLKIEDAFKKFGISAKIIGE